MTYDRFHTESDKIYLLKAGGDIRKAATMLQPYLKTHYPEIKEIAVLFKIDYEDEDGSKKQILQVTPSFFDLFGIEFLSGNKEKFFKDTMNLLLTDREVKRKFQGKLPSGEKILFNNNRVRNTYPFDRSNFFPEEYRKDFTIGRKEYTVTGMVKAWPGHSDFMFDYIMPFREKDRIGPVWVYTFIKLHPDVDPKVLENKWAKDQAIIEKYTERTGPFALSPLHDYHLSAHFAQYPHNMSFEKIVLFAISALIAVLCLLFNYLSLFVARIQQRKQNMALRMALGASFWQLYRQMSVEFLMILSGAFLIGCVIIETVMPVYLEFTKIQNDSYVIWFELTLYFILIVILSLLLLLWPMFYIRMQTFASLFRPIEGSKEKRMFSQNILLIAQLTAGIMFIFCSTVFVKQIQYMKNIDPGFNPKRLCFLETHTQTSYGVLTHFRENMQTIASSPEIESVCYYHSGTIEFNKIKNVARINDAGSDSSKVVICQEFSVSPPYFETCEIKCLRGSLFNNENLDWNNDKTIINQTMAMQFGKEDPIGQTIKYDDKLYRIVGIVSDIYASGVQEILPVMYRYSNDASNIAFRYKQGMRLAAEQRIKNVESNGMEFQFHYMDDRFETEQKEDMNFIRLLYILSAVCIIGSMFGIYSMVSLACERRRKEIAIRKINGAGIGTLIKLFLRKYVFLLTISSAIAFPVGYMFMKPWIEQFVRQTSVNIWVYAAIFFIVLSIIVLIVVTRIWRTLHANPALELRKE